MAITVFRLKQQLELLPDSMLIVMQSDDEGNNYKYLRGIDGHQEGNDTNFFDPTTKECFRGLDLADMGLTLETAGQPVAVLF